MKQIIIRRWEVVAAFTFNVIAIVIVAILFTQLYHDNHALAIKNRAVAFQTHRALCTFKEDLRDRINRTETFIRNHPSGILGISPTDLQLTLMNQKRTLNSLSDLTC